MLSLLLEPEEVEVDDELLLESEVVLDSLAAGLGALVLLEEPPDSLRLSLR